MMAACDDYYYYGYHLETHPPSLVWNLDDVGAVAGTELGNGNGILDESMSLSFLQPRETVELFSTGYLEDAVVQWSDRCKRRRTLRFPQDQEDLAQDLWNSCYDFGTSSSMNSLAEINAVAEAISGTTPSMCSALTKGAATPAENNVFMLLKEQELVSPSSASSSSSCKQVDVVATANIDDVPGRSGSAVSTTGATPPDPAEFHTPRSSTAEGEEDRKDETTTHPPDRKKTTTRVVCPFAVVRPGGADGAVTLNDINRRLLMRPTRPVRHPVGEFACLPCVSSGKGPGLSGKAVVGITRIQTRGRGTITIIRTKG